MATSPLEASPRKMGMPLLIGSTLFTAVLAVSWLALPEAEQAQGTLPKLNLDLLETTASGISSGAFMATQMAVAHSDSIKGVAVTAGGPYFCAGKESWSGAGLSKAIARCMQGDPMFPVSAITEDDQRLMRETTQRWAKEGKIDPLDRLVRQKVWIFHGYNDGIVKTPVSNALETYYRAFVPAHQIFHKRELPAAHAQISAACANSENETGASCNVCDVTGGNFINVCSVDKTPYDAAGMALQFFYGPMQRTASDQLKGKLLSFNQALYTLMDDRKIKPDKISMAGEGYLYVPQSCLEGKACRLHIAFHGCQQNAGKINMDFVKSAGYNEWAEQNHLVVLFPQAASSAMLPMNPNACWDWWGYNDTGDRHAGHYATKNGFQIAAVWRMVQALANPDEREEGKQSADEQVVKNPAHEILLTAPVAQVLDVSSSQVLLTWEAVPNAATYRVYRLMPGLDPGDKGEPTFLMVTPEDFTGTAYVDDGLKEKTLYQYRVTALDEAGKETSASSLTAQTSGLPPACDPYYSMLMECTVDRHGLPTDSRCP
ncbi:hypothetical protein [Azonexus sp.]|uniref:extracellular catalytic domain type 2 short-chain-length polyhydroxyalkanoate depolymerase n=1 Tax=Azonexus sp. TaxID=1872668 RepID=UPI00282F1CB9|nr:hypothetical protein [Azonexus sp.]MDR1995049.1 hypothetical protein [Azonexus sp.]